MTHSRLFSVAFSLAILLNLSGIYNAALGANTPDQKYTSQLGPGDAVTVQLFGEWEVANVPVSDDGMISVPLVGNVQVGGATPVEGAARVSKALKDGGYFVDPHVNIIVTHPGSQLVSVLGEVQKVGRYPVSPRTTIMDLLAQAGGLKDTASDVGYVLRADDNGKISRHPVKIARLDDVTDSEPSLRLIGGDSLVIPRAEHVYVQGEVASPGTYPIEEGMTVIQAVARAGGVNERGSERRIQLKRRGKDGQYEVVRVKPGDLVQADDMIRVKESVF